MGGDVSYIYNIYTDKLVTLSTSCNKLEVWQTLEDQVITLFEIPLLVVHYLLNPLESNVESWA